MSGTRRTFRILGALGHSVSSPKTQRNVRQINDDIVRSGRRPATVRPRIEFGKEQVMADISEEARRANTQLGKPSPMMDYPFPLSTGQVARLEIPKHLTVADAERLGAFVRALAAESS